MKSLNKILFLIVALALTGIFCKAQSTPVLPDSTNLTINTSSQEQTEKMQEQNRKQDQDQNQDQNQKTGQQKANSQNKTQGKTVKQVKSARPDFSKSKGARPKIKRPSGSGIPKGVGKPGGAGRKGGS